MRTKILTLLACVFIGVGTTWAQSFQDFMYQTGGELIASMAHPTNTYSSCSHTAGQNTLTVSVYYTEGYTTTVRFYMSGPIAYRMEVLNDTDFFPPFLAAQNFKDIVYNFVGNAAPELIASLEEKIGSKVRDMDGRQLTCLAFTLSLIDYFT